VIILVYRVIISFFELFKNRFFGLYKLQILEHVPTPMQYMSKNASTRMLAHTPETMALTKGNLSKKQKTFF
jgi:hypothetical protein